MKTPQEYEIKIRTEKHGVYHDHGPFTIVARGKKSATLIAMNHLAKRIERLYLSHNKYKVTAYKNVMEDTIGSEVSIIIKRTV